MGQRIILIIIILGSIFTSCEDTNLIEPKDVENVPPHLSFIGHYDSVTAFRYGYTYGFVCYAWDEDGEIIDHTWTICYRDYYDSRWIEKTDTLPSDSFYVQWTSDITNYFTVNCYVTDSDSAVGLETKRSFAQSPPAIINTNWTLVEKYYIDWDMHFEAIDDKSFIYLENDGYYSAYTPCKFGFGEFTITNDSLVFSELIIDTEPDSCDQYRSEWSDFKGLDYKRWGFEVESDSLILTSRHGTRYKFVSN